MRRHQRINVHDYVVTPAVESALRSEFGRLLLLLALEGVRHRLLFLCARRRRLCRRAQSRHGTRKFVPLEHRIRPGTKRWLERQHAREAAINWTGRRSRIGLELLDCAADRRVLHNTPANERTTTLRVKLRARRAPVTCETRATLAELGVWCAQRMLSLKNFTKKTGLCVCLRLHLAPHPEVMESPRQLVVDAHIQTPDH